MAAMARWSLALGIAAGSTQLPSVAHACQCAGPRAPVRQAFAEADLVAEAEVLAHDFVTYTGFVTKLRVISVHKGPALTHVELSAAKTCAVGFTKGTRWLVYAWQDADGSFGTNFCSRTAPLADAKDELAVIARLARATTPSGATTPPRFAWSDDVVRSLVRLAALALLAPR